jgi:hypothetical protein
MIEKIGLDGTYDDDDGEDGEEELHGVKNMRIHPDEEGILVRFYSAGDAAHFRHSYNGDYWKNNTLHVQYRPDAEIEELLHERSGNSKDSTKLFVGGVRGLTIEEICSAFRPVVLNDVKIAKEFAFVFLASVDAVAIVDEHQNGMRLPNGRKIYPSPLKDKKDAAAFAAARAKMAAAPKGLVPVASKPVQHAFPVALKVAQLSRPTALPSMKTVVNDQVQGLVAQTASMTLVPSGVRVKLNNLPPWTTEKEVRNLFAGFAPHGPSVLIKPTYGFVWLTSDAEAQRAVAALDKASIRVKAVTVKIAES